MARIQSGMTSHEAIEAVMKRVPSARGSNRNLSTRQRAEKALNSLNAKQVCCIIDALWDSVSRGGYRATSTAHTYDLMVGFFAGKIREKEEKR